MPPRSQVNATDHDLLIRIDTKLESLASSVRENNAAVAMRLDQLGKEKVNYGDLDVLRRLIDEKEGNNDQRVKELKEKDASLQKELDWARRMIWIAIGISATLQIIVVPVIIAIALRALSR
jgi:uncharacterized membrane protein